MQTGADHRVFFKQTEADIVVPVLLVHVDDCTMITGSSARLINGFKIQMNRTNPLAVRYQDKLRPPIFLSQHLRYNFTDLKPSAVPNMDPSAPLSKSQSPTKLADIAWMKNIPYREAVGSLMYAAMGTRSDIHSSLLCQLKRQLSSQITLDGLTGKLRSESSGTFETQKLELVYGGEKRGLEGYVDAADGASLAQEHRRATSGFEFLVDGGAVHWSSKKQELVTLSTMEAGYVAATTHAAKEAIWI